MNVIKVEQMTGSKGQPVKNQFVIHTDEGAYFQSYNSIIAWDPHKDTQKLLDETYWNYSRTTSKYRSLFLGEDTKTTQSKIDDGTYALVNLNQAESDRDFDRNS